jgi:hypothetical protein
MPELIAALRKSWNRKLEVSRLEVAGEVRIALHELERVGERWTPTRSSLAIAPALVPALIEALQLAALPAASSEPTTTEPRLDR